MKLTRRFSALLTAAVICCTAAPLSVSAVKQKTSAAVSTDISVSETAVQPETAAAVQKTSIDYSCTPQDIIAIKGLKEGQYTLSGNCLYYRCRFYEKDAVTYCYFSNGTLSFFLTGIVKGNNTETDLLSAYYSINETYRHNLGEPMLSYENITGNVWKAGGNYVISAFTVDSVISMNLSSSYMNEILAGNAVMPKI